MSVPDTVEVHVTTPRGTEAVGSLRRHAGRRGESVTFEYASSWLADAGRFAIDPNIPLGRGTFAPLRDRALPAAIGGTAPDSWGRRLMQRAERHAATREGRRVRTLGEADYLLGVSDETRLGALRFRLPQESAFRAASEDGVPSLLALGRLLQGTERILRDEATDADLALVLAPGSSLGGARPKASVRDVRGRLSIAKFPKEDDDYSLELWEEVALRLADAAGIETAGHELIDVAGRAVLLSRRFDRLPALSGGSGSERRVPFVSAMTLTDSLDGERGSYPEIVDALARHGASPRADAEALYRRVVFNVLISNVDDHLRNHGALRESDRGWRLCPAYDLNPTPVDLKARILSTNIDLDDGTCSIELVREVSPLFDLDTARAETIIGEVARATRGWRDVARQLGERPRAIERMASAFEHEDLDTALALE